MKSLISCVGHKGINFLNEVLTESKYFDEIESAWNEKHRFYHDSNHLSYLIELIEKYNTDGEIKRKLYLISIFHDVVYDVHSSENEELSAETYKRMVGDRFEQDIYDAILDTKDHTKTPSNPISESFLLLDIYDLVYGSLEKIIHNSKLLLKEFGHLDWIEIKKSRIAFVEKFSPHVLSINPDSKIKEYSEWVRFYEPNIAVFAGTFFPYHKGHDDVLKKAEKIFDKVIVACGVNPTKNNLLERASYINDLKKLLPNNQVELFTGFLTDYINQKPYPVTIVKGLRNPSDFDAEKLQLRYMEDMNPNLKITYIISDRRYEHISSSGINAIKLISDSNFEKNYLL
jgi:pantetheine-phosphate adenylyltransferase